MSQRRTPNVSLSNTINTSITTSNLTVAGQVSQQQIIEVLNIKTGATGSVTHDFSTGSIWYHSSITSNFTTALTNVPTTLNRSAVVSLILIQGLTPYYSSTITINGSAASINWPNAALPTPTANRREIESLTLLNVGGNWTVFGQYLSLGLP